MLLIITSTSDELFSGANIDDLQWLWISKIGAFSFFAIFAVAHISRMNCTKSTTDRFGCCIWIFFTIECTFQPYYFWSPRFWKFCTEASDFGTFSRRIITLLHAVHWLPRWQERCCRGSHELCSNYSFYFSAGVKQTGLIKIQSQEVMSWPDITKILFSRFTLLHF